MALTRRTPRFGELAAAIDQRLQDAGVQVPPGVVDAALNEQIATVGALLGMSPRTALVHAPDELPDITARSILLTDKADRGPIPRLRSV
jgi:hypothetical protein